MNLIGRKISRGMRTRSEGIVSRPFGQSRQANRLGAFGLILLRVKIIEFLIFGRQDIADQPDRAGLHRFPVGFAQISRTRIFERRIETRSVRRASNRTEDRLFKSTKRSARLDKPFRDCLARNCNAVTVELWIKREPLQITLIIGASAERQIVRHPGEPLVPAVIG